jgi:ubiquinone/menaquinone biosynthesis C-methylase UbiE
VTRPELAGTFGHPGVVAAYRHRPPYPDEVFTILERLIADRPRDVLDVGAGEGALARPLAARVDQVDAVDVSAPMVAAGRDRPGGRRENLRWIVGAVETCALGGPYALVTAGASLHWMATDRVLARLAGVLTGHAVLAVVEHGPRDVPWRAELIEIIKRHSRSPDFDPGYSVADELGLTGRAETAPVPFRQHIRDYVEQFHSTASLARELMPAEEAAGFDHAVAAAARPWAVDGVLEMPIVATLAWGRPSRSR